MENKLLAYTGAIIDGEGCICIGKKNNKNYQLAVNVASIDNKLIELLLNNFGGYQYHGKPKGNQQQFWIWELTGYKKIISFLERIIPYLLIKREQAELALKFAKQRENIINLARDNREYSEAQIKIYEELKRLKKECPSELPRYNFTEEENLYYLAGLIDGEGSIRITKAVHKNQYGNEKLILVPQISIANTDKRLMDFLKKEFGGFVMEKKREGKRRTLYQWYAQGNDKKDLYVKLKDKLLIKNERLNLLLRYLELRERNYQRTEEELRIFLELRDYNKKGKEKYEIEKLKEYTKLIRNPRKFFLEKEKLEELYIHKKLSVRQIAKLYNVSFNTVRERLIKHNMSLRDFKEGIKLNPPKLTDEGRKAISEAVSKSKKEAWQDPGYRQKMEKNLELARMKISQNRRDI